MTVVLARRADIDVDAFRRAAWEEEPVAVEAETLAEVDRRRRQFLDFLAANPGRRFYGVNVHAGDGSDRPLSEADQRDYARGMQSAVSFGSETLPRRVVGAERRPVTGVHRLEPVRSGARIRGRIAGVPGGDRRPVVCPDRP